MIVEWVRGCALIDRIENRNLSAVSGAFGGLIMMKGLHSYYSFDVTLTIAYLFGIHFQHPYRRIVREIAAST